MLLILYIFLHSLYQPINALNKNILYFIECSHLYLVYFIECIHWLIQSIQTKFNQIKWNTAWHKRNCHYMLLVAKTEILLFLCNYKHMSANTFNKVTNCTNTQWLGNWSLIQDTANIVWREEQKLGNIWD